MRGEALRVVPKQDREPKQPRIRHKEPPKDAVAATHEATMREIEDINALRRKGVKNPEALQRLLKTIEDEKQAEKKKMRPKGEEKEIELHHSEIQEILPEPPPLPPPLPVGKNEATFSKEEKHFFEAGERGEGKDRSIEENIPHLVKPRSRSSRGTARSYAGTFVGGASQTPQSSVSPRDIPRGLSPLPEEQRAAETMTVEDYVTQLALYGVTVKKDGDVGFWSQWKHKTLYKKSDAYAELFDDYVAQVERERVVSKKSPIASRIAHKKGVAEVFTKDIKGRKGTGESGEKIVGWKK